MRRREDGERGTSKSISRSEWGRAVEEVTGGPADLKRTKGQGHEHLCDTGMHVRYGNLGDDHTTTTKAASVRKQLGTNNSKSNVCMYVCMYVCRQQKNGGVKGRESGAEELDT